MGFGILFCGIGLLTIWGARNPDWYGENTRYRNLIDAIGLRAAKAFQTALGLVMIGFGAYMIFIDAVK